MVNLRKEKGVTLIALVVTIIVLVILAGISINAIIGDNGIINKASESGKNYAAVEDEEAQKRANLATYMEKKMNGGKTKYKDNNGDEAIIPDGFTVSENEDEQTIDTGLVVKDGDGNEWVWIPVEDASSMFTTQGAPYTLSGSTGVTSPKASKSEILSGQTRVMPGNVTSYREPDLVLGSGTQYDYENYGTAGFGSFNEMANSLTDDFNSMIESINKYKGFYVGRFELCGTVENPNEKASGSLLRKNWYESYKICKKFSIDGIVEARMIFDCQWDMIMMWMSSNGLQDYVMTDSANNGNLVDGTRSNTNRNENYKVNNIYDLKGNCWEWTQGAYDNTTRVIRGGGTCGSTCATMTRYKANPTVWEDGDRRLVYTSRPTLFIK